MGYSLGPGESVGRVIVGKSGCGRAAARTPEIQLHRCELHTLQCSVIECSALHCTALYCSFTVNVTSEDKHCSNDGLFKY